MVWRCFQITFQLILGVGLIPQISFDEVERRLILFSLLLIGHALCTGMLHSACLINPLKTI